MAKAKNNKCLVCGMRPRLEGSRYCNNDKLQIEAEVARRKAASKPEKYMTYRGHVLGFYKCDDGLLRPRQMRVDPKRLPATHTLDLNRWIDGFSREQIKGFKRLILRMCEPQVRVVRIK